MAEQREGGMEHELSLGKIEAFDNLQMSEIEFGQQHDDESETLRNIVKKRKVSLHKDVKWMMSIKFSQNVFRARERCLLRK